MTIGALITTGDTFGELARAFGDNQGEVGTIRAILRWGAAAVPFAALAWIEPHRRMRRLADVFAVLVGYVLIAQFAPGPALAWTLALAVAGFAWFQPQRTGLWASALVLGLFWALVPVFEWAGALLAALAGKPAFVSDLPEGEVALRRILPFALAAWKASILPLLKTLLVRGSAAIVLMVLHILYKQVFAILDTPDFAAFGLAERTVWQTLLTASGIALMRLFPQPPGHGIGRGLAIGGLAYFAWFTLALHNPLWSEQATGSWPLANLIAPAHIVPGGAVWWLTRSGDDTRFRWLRQAGDAALMLLIAAWSLSELRHSFAGSILVDAPMTQTEDLLRSFVGIMLALGFLWWGSRKGLRSWRIGSLVLILIAVLKVFLVDAAGLEGLLRVASFIALGASLIAIGWVYSRQLSRRGEDASEPSQTSP